MFNVEDVGILIYLILIIHAIFCKHTDKKVSIYHLRNERGFDCVNLFFYTFDEYTGNGQNMVYYKCIYFMRF